MRCGKNYWPAGAFIFCAISKLRAINRPKSDPRLFFFSDLFINGQAFIISGKKITNFFSIVQGSAREKTYKLLSIRGFTLLIRANNYKTAVAYMNPRCQLLVCWRHYWSPERNKNGQNRPKKGSKPNFLFARSSRYNCPTFYEKKNSSSQSL